MKALNDSAAAHLTALNFYETALKSFGPTSTDNDRDIMRANLVKCAEEAERLIPLVQKWQKRAAEMKEAK